MSASRLLERLIVWMVLIGFIVFSVGYLYLFLVIFQRLNLPLQVLMVILGLILVFLSLVGLRIFRRFFVVQE